MHNTAVIHPLQRGRALRGIEAECIKIEVLPGRHPTRSHTSTHPLRGRGAKCTITIKNQNRQANGRAHPATSPITGCAARMRWSKPTS